MIKISRNTDLIIIHDLIFEVRIVIRIGRSSANSTSKIMKITAIKKNRDEKGVVVRRYFWVKSALKWRFFVSAFIDFP